MTFRRAALWSVLGGIALSVGGNLPLMGIPGALALMPVEGLIASLWGVPPGGMFPRDSAWPYAIMTTLALGPVVPFAVLLPWRLRGWPYRLAAAALFVAGAALVAVLVYALGVAPLLPGRGA